MALRGNKIRAEEGGKVLGQNLPPPPPLLLTVPLQVVKVKNSRGGQEGSEGPGVATAERPEPVFLSYLVQSGLEIKDAGESPETQVTLSDYRGACQERLR